MNTRSRSRTRRLLAALSMTALLFAAAGAGSGRGGETATLFARAIVNTVTQLRSAPQQQPVFPPGGF